MLRSTTRLNNMAIQLQNCFSKQMSSLIVKNQLSKQFLKVTLNSPQTLNAFNMEMAKDLSQCCKDWNNSGLKVVYFNSVSTKIKAFCAGGDIKSLYDNKKNNVPNQDAFFRQEFQTDYQLSQMKPTQICIYDGIVMGGGVGLSVFSRFRIATENSVYAMPEAKIGFFTDIASSYFLPRLKHNLGFYLALTGQRLKGKQLTQVGVADYYVQSDKLEQLENELIQAIDENSTEFQIKQVVEKYAEKIDLNYENQEQIGNLMEADTFKQLYSNLEKQDSKIASQIIEQINQQCPLSLRIIFDQLKKGKNLSLQECFKMDFRIASRFLEGNDFFEGIRCTLIDRKDKPQWTHKSPFDIDQAELEKYFENLPQDKELQLE